MGEGQKITRPLFDLNIMHSHPLGPTSGEWEQDVGKQSGN